MTEFARTLLLDRPAATVAGDGRTIDVQLVKWDQPYEVSDDGRLRYFESFAPGGLVPSPAMFARTSGHVPIPGLVTKPDITNEAGVVVGRIVETHYRADGLYGTIRLADNADGDRLRGLLPDVLDTLSIEFDDTPLPTHLRPGQHVRRTAARLTGVAFTLHPQRQDARVLAVRSQQHPEETHMDTEPTTPPAQPETAPAADPVTPVTTSAQRSEPVHVHVHNGQPAAPAPAPHQRTAPVPGNPAAANGGTGGQVIAEAVQSLQFLHQFANFGEFCRAAALARDHEEIEQHRRALGVAVQTTAQLQTFRRAQEVAVLADVAGLLPPHWLTEVIDLVRTMTPTVSNWDTGPLPDDGMVITQPKIGDRPSVTKQAAELTEVASNKVTVGTQTWGVETFSGGQEMSIQVVKRTSPDYLSIVMRLYVAEAARAWNSAVALGIAAAADDTNTALEFVDGKTFPDLVIDASAIFLATLGRPAEVVGMSIALWKALGKAKDADDRYMFPDIAAMNVVGSFDATSPQGQVRKISYYVEPALTDSATEVSGVIGVREAYRTLQGPLNTLTADMPSTLAQGIAVYQFGAHGAVDTRGLVLIADAA